MLENDEIDYLTQLSSRDYSYDDLLQLSDKPAEQFECFLDVLRKKGFIMVGGGVGDSYQPVEKKYELTRKTLELLYQKGFPVHILTKSTLVERDLDLLKKINKKKSINC